MAEKASTIAAKDVVNSKTVLELLEEDDEFEVSQATSQGMLNRADLNAQRLILLSILFLAKDDCLVKVIIKLFSFNRNLKVPHGTMT